MNTKDYIIKNLIENNNNTYDFLKSNSLLSLCNNFGYENIFYKNQNSLNYLYNQKIICYLTKILTEQNIKYIVFKGICLSEILYDDPTDRKVGDIDIYVNSDSHNEVIKILNCEGITIKNEESDYVHHIGLTNGKALI